MSIEVAAQHAYAFLEELAVATASPPGVSRDSFGDGEGAAHAMVERQAQALGLEHRTDPIGNLYVTLPGADRNAPAIMMGSHLDSVHHGGNFDGDSRGENGLVSNSLPGQPRRLWPTATGYT